MCSASRSYSTALSRRSGTIIGFPMPAIIHPRCFITWSG